MVEIEDNGIGFTQENYLSFETIDSRYKALRGGKGLGRILWLKAFDHAEIESTYREHNVTRRRSFTFNRSKDGIENHTIEDLQVGPASVELGTAVRLVGFTPRYRDQAPKSAEAIARRIVEHCMEYFLLGNAPQMFVIDDYSSEMIDLANLFNVEYRPEAGSRSICVGEVKLSITDVLLKATGDAQHRVHLCAHSRVVQSFSLAQRIPHLESTLPNQEGDPSVYVGYVTGSFLDERVDSERTSFNIDRQGEFAFSGGPVWEEVISATMDSVSEYLEPRTREIRQLALARIRTFVEDREPKYRPLLTHRREQIENIPGSLSDTNLDVELHKLLNEWRQDVRREANLQLEQADVEAGAFQQHSEKFRKVLGELQEVAKSDLADYVVHRATVLSFFEKLLGKQEDGRFPDEGSLHGLVFPQRKSSEEIDFDDHSLWVLDERLAYHRYLASDLPLSRQTGPISVESHDRPDLLIYNTPFAFSPGFDPFSSVVIVEFKRPERDDYNEGKNPIRQVLGYVRQIRDGRAKRPDGSTIEPARDVPFYCYVVATLTKSLRTEAEDLGYTRTPDGQGYFHYNPVLNAYIEVLSFRKVLEDAKKRNRAFFDRLQITMH